MIQHGEYYHQNKSTPLVDLLLKPPPSPNTESKTENRSENSQPLLKTREEYSKP
jgi:hypothetical protein